MLAIVSLALASSPMLAQSKLLALRGGMSLGAISSKYAGIEGTTLTKTFSGGVWNDNLIISMIAGVTSTVVYSVGASSFDAAQLTAVLWLASVLIDLKDAGFDFNSLMDSKVRTGVAVLGAYLAFA